MRKASPINLCMLLISGVSTFAAYICGEMLLLYVTYLPYWVQCGLYLLFIMIISCTAMTISESIRSGGYIMKRRAEFKQTVIKAAAIFLPSAFVLGMVTQLLYGLVGVAKAVEPVFQGSMIVCDISGSMNGNDPDKEAVKAILSYIDSIPTDEYIGLIVFNDEAILLRNYMPIKSEAERNALKRLVLEKVTYDGDTDIQTALTEAIYEMRTLENPDWPGLVLLFSDGLSHINYKALHKAALGDIDNPKNRIPVNTIYYSSNPFGGYQMSAIAQKTGGTYYYMGINNDDSLLQDAFKLSRSIFKVEKPHLIQSYFGAVQKSAVRIILQVLFLTLWGVFSGALVVVFLNNNLLIRHFMFPKIIFALIFAIIIVVIMLKSNTDSGMLARALLAIDMCVMYLPTYRWD